MKNTTTNTMTETAPVTETVKTETSKEENTMENTTTENNVNTLTEAVKKAVLISWGDDTFIEKDGNFVSRTKGDSYALFFRATMREHKGKVISVKERLLKRTWSGICAGMGKSGFSTNLFDKYIRRAVSIMVNSGYCHIYQAKKDWYVHMTDAELKKFYEDYKEAKTSK